ncbi:MAG: hypothetical protein KME49_06150 [Brasilonema octagenarum HA4186-MV1]|jgi:hypothetical protein|uniref:Uncharacterized protein n=2 Tax=Brasilonema TaxID=383614 RepID=A0A856MGR4_9CYAN|nr:MULTISPECIES: hypothetical protein [Brasilonema]MBW4625084.1 hypothetical protein [Brasilonema octagenarum HA4186-MV1]NMF65106.1 hypothetical protein [Brasilonema octagenarum UFV-OR1]QDL10413.1 hypothetical protein DP114_23210 [Brasilonema sennae CENA114]QDL16759.1 hypothetical protein DP113_23115 [Brasilonema octagenarum UFV-E1]
MPHYSTTQPTEALNTHSQGTADAHTNNLIGLSIISFPLFLLMSIITYKKYRTTVYRRRIAILEKIWLMDVKNNTYRQD